MFWKDKCDLATESSNTAAKPDYVLENKEKSTLGIRFHRKRKCSLHSSSDSSSNIEDISYTTWLESEDDAERRAPWLWEPFSRQCVNAWMIALPSVTFVSESFFFSCVLQNTSMQTCSNRYEIEDTSHVSISVTSLGSGYIKKLNPISWANPHRYVKHYRILYDKSIC